MKSFAVCFKICPRCQFSQASPSSLRSRNEQLFVDTQVEVFFYTLKKSIGCYVYVIVRNQLIMIPAKVDFLVKEKAHT